MSGACARLRVVGRIVCSSLSFFLPFSRQPSGEKGVRGSVCAMNGLWRSCLNILFPCIYRVIGEYLMDWKKEICQIWIRSSTGVLLSIYNQ